MIPLLGGADRVITFCRDSRYARTEEVELSMRAAYTQVDMAERYEFQTKINEEDVFGADIVTNSGHLRPFDSAFLERMKGTAVLSLMWEPWELRPGEVDINTAKRRGILVMGTNEHDAPCDMRPYSFLTAMHLLMAHQTPLVDGRILVIGDQTTLAFPIEEGLSKLGLEARRISMDVNQTQLEEMLDWATYVLVAEHSDSRVIIGVDGLITAVDLLKADIAAVGVIAGFVDRNDLESNGVSVYPDQIAPAGYMSYLPSVLGPNPVMDLFAAGLKVGEIMARARLSGMPVTEAAKWTLAHSPALDLDGEMAWI